MLPAARADYGVVCLPRDKPQQVLLLSVLQAGPGSGKLLASCMGRNVERSEHQRYDICVTSLPVRVLLGKVGLGVVWYRDGIQNVFQSCR